MILKLKIAILRQRPQLTLFLYESLSIFIISITSPSIFGPISSLVFLAITDTLMILGLSIAVRLIRRKKNEIRRKTAAKEWSK